MRFTRAFSAIGHLTGPLMHWILFSINYFGWLKLKKDLVSNSSTFFACIFRTNFRRQVTFQLGKFFWWNWLLEKQSSENECINGMLQRYLFMIPISSKKNNCSCWWNTALDQRFSTQITPRPGFWIKKYPLPEPENFHYLQAFLKARLPLLSITMLYIIVILY